MTCLQLTSLVCMFLMISDCAHASNGDSFCENIATNHIEKYGSCYWQACEPDVTWDMGQAKCKTFHDEAYLATFPDEQVLDMIQGTVVTTAGCGTWHRFGARRDIPPTEYTNNWANWVYSIGQGQFQAPMTREFREQRQKSGTQTQTVWDVWQSGGIYSASGGDLHKWGGSTLDNTGVYDSVICQRKSSVLYFVTVNQREALSHIIANYTVGYEHGKETSP